MSEQRANSLEPTWLDYTRSLERGDTRYRSQSQPKGDVRSSDNNSRRGFTLNGQPIPDALIEEKVAIVKVREEGSAYFFWAIYITLVLLALGNLGTTIFIIRVLRLGPEGLESLEFPSGSDLVKIWGDANLGEVVKKDGKIYGFSGENMVIEGRDGAEVVMQAGKDDIKSPRMTVSESGVELTNVHDLSVLDPSTGKVIFSTSDPEFVLPSDTLMGLEAMEAEVGEIVSPLDQDMLVRSDAELDIRGAEGVLIEGKTIDLSSNGDISLTSIGGGIELSGGLTLDTVMLPHGGGGYKGEIGQFKLCVCMPSGQLFKVALPDDNPVRPPALQVGCNSVDLSKENVCK